MKEYEGKVILKTVDETQKHKILDAEVYLNGVVAAEVYRRYGVSLRVHITE